MAALKINSNLKNGYSK